MFEWHGWIALRDGDPALLDRLAADLPAADGERRVISTSTGRPVLHIDGLAPGYDGAPLALATAVVERLPGCYGVLHLWEDDAPMGWERVIIADGALERQSEPALPDVGPALSAEGLTVPAWDAALPKGSAAIMPE